MIYMLFEICYTRKIEADDFFDAVDKAKEVIEDIEEIVAVQPWIDTEEDLIV